MVKQTQSDGLRIERVALDAIQLDPANVRAHPYRNLEATKGSLARFGQQKPVVIDGRDMVVAGNCTVEAARALGWTEIDAVRTGLEGVEATAFTIADNRTAELAEWDYEALACQLQTLVNESVDLQALGWKPHELEPMLAADWSPPVVGELPGGSSDGEAKSISVTAEQREIFERAAAKVRKSNGDLSLAEGACVALICEECLGP